MLLNMVSGCPKYDRRVYGSILTQEPKDEEINEAIPPSTRRQDTGTDGNEAMKRAK